jgi:hypothetical protein
MFHDWMPTFAEVAKVPAPARADGVSLLPKLTGSGTQKPATVYVEYQAGQTTPPYPQFEASRQGRQRKQMQMIRLGDFTGVRYEVQKHADPFEIYNVAKDSKQTRNLASELPDLQTKMHDAVLRMRRPDPSAPRPYDAELVPAVNGSATTTAGVMCRTFSQQMPWLARLEDLTPAATSSAVGLGEINLPAGTTALLVTGYINVETAGEYTFGVPGGANALLRIHDATVIDGAFAPVDGVRDGVIRLAAGKHPFRLYWKTGNGTPSPALEWASAGMERQALPPSVLFRDDK